MSETAAILDYVRERTGLSFPPSRIDDARTAVHRAMKAIACENVLSYFDLLRVDQGMFDELIAELTVGETYFFRDTDQFAAIRSHILPEIQQRRGPSHAVRAWSAGCASGEEPYSLAILFLEERADATILGTDISPRSLARARIASYSAWSLRGSEPLFRDLYFRQQGDRFVLQDDIRKRVTFSALNLAGGAYPSASGGMAGLDLILCRNVMIYFDAETVRETGRRLLASLAPGGWLLLGASDPMLEPGEGVQRVMLASGFAYRRDSEPGTLDAPLPLPPIAREVPRPAVVVEAPVFDRPAPVDVEIERATPTIEMEVERLRLAADAGATDAIVSLAAEMIERFPLSAELHLLHALLLLDLGRTHLVEASLRRALFLDPSIPIAHFTLGILQRTNGNESAATRSFLNAIAAADRASDHTSSLGRGSSPAEIRNAAEQALKRMETGS